MNLEKLQSIADSLDGIDKGDWNTIKQLVEMLFQRKSVEKHITINSSEIFNNLKSWSQK